MNRSYGATGSFKGRLSASHCQKNDGYTYIEKVCIGNLVPF